MKKRGKKEERRVGWKRERVLRRWCGCGRVKIRPWKRRITLQEKGGYEDVKFGNGKTK